MDQSKVNVYRIYKEAISPHTRKNGLTLVKCYGCNGDEHRIQFFHLAIDRETKKVSYGEDCVSPDKILGKCDHKSCKNLGFFSPYDGKIRKEKLDRNNKIVIEVLLGNSTFTEMAKEYNISAVRARDIVHKACEKADKRLYNIINNNAKPLLKVLRRHALNFVLPTI
jgi:hypothetical protein